MASRIRMSPQDHIEWIICWTSGSSADQGKEYWLLREVGNHIPNGLGFAGSSELEQKLGFLVQSNAIRTLSLSSTTSDETAWMYQVDAILCIHVGHARSRSLKNDPKPHKTDSSKLADLDLPDEMGYSIRRGSITMAVLLVEEDALHWD
ncbi:hypothetical protein Tco_0319220 [Tanacetum coccineum]